MPSVMPREFLADIRPPRLACPRWDAKRAGLVGRRANTHCPTFYEAAPPGQCVIDLSLASSSFGRRGRNRSGKPGILLSALEQVATLSRRQRRVEVGRSATPSI